MSATTGQTGATILADAGARARFRDEVERNFAVSANAGSGKTTAISERLASMALRPDAGAALSRTAVVTYTRKAAAQIGQRARLVLRRRIRDGEAGDLAPLDLLDGVFFGTIHSFCLKLAQTYGQTLGINLNPEVVEGGDDALWETFLESDAMVFRSLGATELGAFLRHMPLESIFDLARQLDARSTRMLAARSTRLGLPRLAEAARDELLDLPAKGRGAENIVLSQVAARRWQAAFDGGATYLPIYKPTGAAKAVVAAAEAWMEPLKRWLAEAASVMAAELAARYRAWRFERGVQTFADQIDAAMAVLHDTPTLDRIRRDGWRIILDEAQDTDASQFAVLVEATRPPGATVGTWPVGGGEAPRPGQFCMVGDGQQAIYGSRAEVGNFLRHLEAFARGDGGELLEFAVTFRAPHAVIDLLNLTLPAAFGPERDYNLGPVAEEGRPAPYLQVEYAPLVAGPGNAAGRVARLPLVVPAEVPSGVAVWQAEEARQVAAWLVEHGPAGVGAKNWGEVAVLAPRNEWLAGARDVFVAAGLNVALQTRRVRNAEQPVYAWLTGLAAVCADPENTFEWVGVLREVFGVSDALIAAELKRLDQFRWDEPEEHAAPIAAALRRLRPYVLQANDEGVALEAFARGLADVAELAVRASALDDAGDGPMARELERLLAEAAALADEGLGPRDWAERLVVDREQGRPAGAPAADAINLLTSHSAKGLEWPVVIVLGLWRGIGKFTETGFRLIAQAGGEMQVFFDGTTLPGETKMAREFERWRELARLLYVTLTRPRGCLVLPWGEGFGGKQREAPSFAELWGMPEALAALPELAPPAVVRGEEAAAGAEGMTGATIVGWGERPRWTGAGRLADLPRRKLPHQLATKPDLVRSARHESGADVVAPVGGEEAIDYGLWWHETMEFLPWRGDAAAWDAYGNRRVEVAESAGFAVRGRAEWEQFRGSPVSRWLAEARWSRQAEIGVFAPMRDGSWIDGVIDLVLHDAAANEVWIVDWKTNRQRKRETIEAMRERLAAEYAPQLAAYAACLKPEFPEAVVRTWIYASSVGEWIEIRNPE